jgi:ABC-type proline/glycine betaine transport system substrate-binding protein
MKTLTTSAIIATFLSSLAATRAARAEHVRNVTYQTIAIEDVEIFYR